MNIASNDPGPGGAHQMYLVLLLVLGLGCQERGEFRGKSDYAVEKRTPDQLALELNRQCQAALAEKLPLLLEFSANWCADCRALASLKKREPLKTALTKVKRVEINIGNFARHPELLAFYDVDRIATWVLLRPEDCQAPIFRWPRVARLVVEPQSGSVSERDLVTWLAQGGKP